ncbi:mechanosensitive ion channel family protein [Marinobacterium arenosum]|uniref:mechanosensitive ion channel family protein n=1 Tax=Marinobacterium arenosum TaxID=2862496 RepID=UPI001C9883C1|nr:mechanosensitive ion channel family protein [Marinobacterium arenosum]MBY4676320.1 mechanosensitive ion channel family protein [Marinobacterium arenosum]
MEQELETVARLYRLITEFFVNYSFQVIGAIIIFLLGLIVARWMNNLTLRICQRNQIDITLSMFIANCVRLLVIAMVLVICLGKFGISIAPFVAAIGAVSLSVGLALQGVFSNYGAGFTIVLTRPFVIGNTISINGLTGVVDEIRLAYTVLSSEDGERITIPNKHIVGEVITNSFQYKVVEASIGISYSADPQLAIELVRQVLANTPEVASEPLPQIGIEGFGDSSVNIGYRYWLPTQRYFELQYQVNGAVYQAFRGQGVEIPFPQREVTLKQAG